MLFSLFRNILKNKHKKFNILPGCIEIIAVKAGDALATVEEIIFK
ncbi:hypothetical protein Desal_1425 [Maridesulfovibrio salexigens DSM 2638]|uniref:Uncharacterized protein n=1 Tax=Maridesulfovibrio salexigens (strain ATCC 14822 / DSM 2638 / NCIMB 8403 / VKM B-1763) TaxID=526222 RepID=C6BRP7_MARSD|nr:hypothetical protein Desal_1425 [Maridesulfovibrio salexigens DSM 2638]